MAVHIFITGGTFDKEYNELDGTLFFKDSHLKEMLDLGRCKVDIMVRTLMMVDSQEISDEDRQTIANNCMKCVSDKIVITHGTDTMAETAEMLARHVNGKTVILTGAMIPYKFGSSDGLFNLGSALAFAQSLPHGVYIAMNGRYFDAGACYKNRKTGIFEEKE